MKRPAGDVLDSDDWMQPSIGSVSTINTDGAAVRHRAFPPGFHGANPGPSHDDEAPPKRRAKPAA